jgi:hypothetical protein
MQKTQTKKRPANQASIDLIFAGSLKRVKIDPSLHGLTSKDTKDGALINSPEASNSYTVAKTDQ